jgi:phosphatidylserine/phosphatidylglycerophosphate/cardiolipin synthase-like enzyme
MSKLFIKLLVLSTQFIVLLHASEPDSSAATKSYDISVYFNQSVFAPAIQADLEQQIISFINTAQKSIDLAVYDFDLVPIAKAIVKKHKQGITVRFITDNINTGKENEAVLSLFNEAKIPWIDDKADGSLGSGTQHNKFVIVDHKKVLTGSANFTQSGLHGDLDNEGNLLNVGNTNNIVIVNSAQLASLYTSQFEQMWGDGPGGEQDSKFGLSKEDFTLQTVYTDSNKIRIDVLFAPQSKKRYAGSALDVLEQTIYAAKKKIYLAQFVFSAQVLSDAMKIKKQEGLDIKGIGERNFFFRYYSEFMDMAGKSKKMANGNFEIDKLTGHKNNVWENPADVRVANVMENDKFHHKYWIIDTLVVTGSINATAAGTFENDENMIIIHDSNIAEQYKAEFMKRFEEAGKVN